MVRIKFSDVGCDKKTWEADVPTKDGLVKDEDLYQQVKANKALMSTDIEFSDSGIIYAGGGRAVGRWEFVTEGDDQ